MVLCRIRGSRNQGVEAGVVLLFITPNDPLGDLMLPGPVILGSAQLENLVPRGGHNRSGCCWGPLDFLYLGTRRREGNSPLWQELALPGGRREVCPVGAGRKTHVSQVTHSVPLTPPFPTATVHGQMQQPRPEKCMCEETDLSGAGKTRKPPDQRG